MINLKIAMKNQVMFAVLPFEKRFFPMLDIYTELRITILE